MDVTGLFLMLLSVHIATARWIRMNLTENSKTDIKSTTRPLPPTIFPRTCGKSTIQLSRVVGGQNAKPGAWPWNAMIRFHGMFICGGVLISPNWIVTAGHCTDGYGMDGFQIVLGDHNRVTYDNSEQTFKVTKMIRHRRYDQPTIFNNDIAIMKLDKPAMFTPNVQPVCLPRQNEVVGVGKLCYIAGWGRTLRAAQTSHILQQAPLQIISFSDCWRKNMKIAPITDEMICAANIKPSLTIHSGCHGDSGGPLVCRYTDGAWELQGIVSWGSASCNTTDAYTVFARVSKFRYWIDNIISRDRVKKVII
ncbi:chymotrypsin B-like isoform X1 [Hydractinia symbiolongicarpus]|uniref:chymotrypsin B-like isoform X1 n=2 Tax=Hydractinia symbiolongicarpus TaxID=13093 RepID=UPI00254CA029|nr:chymotrypsin B-like isoform X1 [Hydractinia symbiolongicarpus]